MRTQELSPHEQEVLRRLLEDPVALDLLYDLDYRATPVTPREFFTSRFFIGERAWNEKTKTGLYPIWLEELCYVLDPANQIYEWVLGGSLGAGKCLNHKTLVPSSAGILTLAELHENRSVGAKVKQHNGDLGNITQTHDIGLSPTIKVTLKNGYHIEGRPEHRVRVLRDSQVLWSQLGELSLDDVVVLDVGTDLWGTDSTISEAEAELMGAWVGDGYFHTDKRATKWSGYISISVGFGEGEYLNHLQGLATSCGFKYRVQATPSCNQLVIGTMDDARRWKSLGFETGAWNKHIPAVIRASPWGVVSRFLRGVFDTDGTVDTRRGSVELCVVAERLVDEIQTVFLNRGILSSKSFRATASGKGAWRLRVGREYSEMFQSEVGFSHQRKKTSLRESLNLTPGWRKGARGFSQGKLTDAFIGLRRLGVPRKLLGSTGSNTKVTTHELRRVVRDCKNSGFEVGELLEEASTSYLASVVSSENGYSYCMDLSVDPGQSYVANGFKSHNTMVAILALQYQLYKLWCLRNPQGHFGLAQEEQIEFFMFNTNLDLVEDNALGRFEKYMNTSPYFRAEFPENRKKKAEVKIVDGREEKRYALAYPPYFQIVGGSGTQHQIGRNIICGMMDETNFVSGKAKDQYVYGTANNAYKMYSSLRNRIESRFLVDGQIPGLLILISSARSKYDFLESHKQSLKGNKHAHISEFSRWEVSPWKYSNRTFRVFIGGVRANSKVLEDKEEVPADLGGTIIEVPIDFLPSFKRDLNLAVQDIAGIPSDLASPLIPIKDQIFKNVDTSRLHPFTEETFKIGHLRSDSIDQYFKAEEVCVWEGQSLRPKYHPNKIRHIHVDLGLTNDSASMSMGCVFGVKASNFTDSSGKTSLVYAPEVFLDFMLRIDPPGEPEQISISSIRTFIAYLRNTCNFQIGAVSFDGFASEESVQILQNELNAVSVGGRRLNPGTTKRYPLVKVLSVDRTPEPYLALRGATLEERIHRYPYPPYEVEISTVQIDHKSAKVDHLPNTTKDVSDSVAGVVWHCVDQVRTIGDVDYIDAIEMSTPVSRLNPEPPPDVALMVGDYKVW